MLPKKDDILTYLDTSENPIVVIVYCIYYFFSSPITIAGTLLSSASVSNIIQRGGSVDLAKIPRNALDVYGEITESLSWIFVEVWTGVTVPTLVQDYLVLHLAFSCILYRWQHMQPGGGNIVFRIVLIQTLLAPILYIDKAVHLYSIGAEMAGRHNIYFFVFCSIMTPFTVIGFFIWNAFLLAGQT